MTLAVNPDQIVEPRRLKWLRRWLAGWIIVCALFWDMLLLAGEVGYQFLYFTVLCLGFGPVFWRYRAAIRSALHRWIDHRFLRYMLVGYLMVLGEETFAAFFNHVDEGFDLSLLLIRLQQFWTFNVIAFTPMLVGFYILSRRFDYSYGQIAVSTAILGQLYEGTLVYIVGNPLAFVLFVPLNVTVYILIFSPAYFGLPTVPENERTRSVCKIALAVGVIFGLVMITSVLMAGIKALEPGIFPPAKFGF